MKLISYSKFVLDFDWLKRLKLLSSLILIGSRVYIVLFIYIYATTLPFNLILLK